MRIAIFLGLLFGLFFAEAYYQRRRDSMRKFEASLETLRASLGDLTIATQAMNMAYTRFATAASKVAADARRRGEP